MQGRPLFASDFDSLTEREMGDERKIETRMNVTVKKDRCEIEAIYRRHKMNEKDEEDAR